MPPNGQEYGQESERQLFERVRQNDQKAYEQVFRTYYPMLCNYALRLVKNQETAEEIVQDLFCTIWEKRQQIQLSSSLKSYLFGATHNNCLRYLKHQKVRQNYQVETLAQFKEGEPVQDEEFLTFELQQKIAEGINRLPAQCRKIFQLSRYEGLKYKEIAQKAGISVKTVEAQMSKALRILREELKDYLPTLLLFLLFF